MKVFLDESFLLQTKMAQRLYHEFAKDMPIIDYHCHLPPQQIAEDTNFKNLTQIWLYGDHYKWRAMRNNGVDESYCTGDKSDFEKFKKWAATVPYTVRNPLYHWTHLELQRYFDIHEVLTSDSAKKIYDACTEKLQSPEFSSCNLLRKMKVEVVGTTDDPLDTLSPHKKLKEEKFEIKVVPTFRPDKTMQTEDPKAFNDYIIKLEEISGVTISTYQDYIATLKKRHEHFASLDCKASDHGLEHLYSQDFTEKKIEKIFAKIRYGKELGIKEQLQFKSAILLEFAKWDYKKGWVQQFHLGALRNNNSRKMQQLGADSGWDSIGDFKQGKALVRFLNQLDKKDNLAKTILYNVNSADNELMATMIANFNDGNLPGKIQWGSAWWFLDQKDGMTRHLDTLSNMGLLSRFVGMITDSRSFLSYPRHEYFRRILCNLFGDDIENGELPNDINWIGKIIQDICYYNAKNYFNW